MGKWLGVPWGHFPPPSPVGMDLRTRLCSLGMSGQRSLALGRRLASFQRLGRAGEELQKQLRLPVCHRAGEDPAYQREPGGFRRLPSKAVGNLLVEVLGKLKISPRFARFPPPPSPAPCCPHSFFVINCFRFRQCLSFGLRQAHWLNH